jgi:multidrug efflux pump subunit AcrB
VRLGDVAQYSFDSAISSVSREDTNVTIRVESAVQEGITPDGVQSQLVEFANTYDFPAGITREA